MDQSDKTAEQQPPAEDLADEAEDFDDSTATVLSPLSKLKTEDLPAGMTPRELAHTLQGEMLDQFHLQQFVGGGGMGVVFKARDTTLDRIVAVKVVASHSLSTEDLKKRFLVEAQSAARLDHPNIARIYDSGRSRGLPYIVFEFIEGANIRDLVLNHGPLPLGDALSYTYQIAHALTHASQREVIHRDIKPSNILVTREGQAKLVDMGLARLYQVDTQEEELTNTGVTLGTFDYISPEQARDPRLADSRSDIYSLGCTLFYMLAGHPPFSQATPAQKLLKHQGERPPELLVLRPELPETVGKLVQRMLAKQPADRPQTPTELIGALAEILSTEGLQVPLALSPQPVVSVSRRPQAWRRHLPWALPIAALLAINSWLNWGNRLAIEEGTWPEIRTISGVRADEETTPQQPVHEPTLAPTISTEPIAAEAISNEPIAPAETIESQDGKPLPKDAMNEIDEDRALTDPQAVPPVIDLHSPTELLLPKKEPTASAEEDAPIEQN